MLQKYYKLELLVLSTDRQIFYLENAQNKFGNNLFFVDEPIDQQTKNCSCKLRNYKIHCSRKVYP